MAKIYSGGSLTTKMIYERHLELARDYQRWSELDALKPKQKSPANDQLRFAVETEILAKNMDLERIVMDGEVNVTLTRAQFAQEVAAKSRQQVSVPKLRGDLIQIRDDIHYHGFRGYNFIDYSFSDYGFHKH